MDPSDLCEISHLLLHPATAHNQTLIFHIPRMISRHVARPLDIAGNKLEGKMPVTFTRKKKKKSFNKSMRLYSHERRVYIQ